MKEPELKPCPICGKEVRFAFTADLWPRGIWCRTCHLKAEWSNIPQDGKSTAGEVMKAIADRWNGRA